MRTGQDLVLVMGATGQQGDAVARVLLGRGHCVRATTRRPDSEPARALAANGAEIVQADFDDPASLEQAMAGAWGAFGVQNIWEAGGPTVRRRASRTGPGRSAGADRGAPRHTLSVAGTRGSSSQGSSHCGGER